MQGKMSMSKEAAYLNRELETRHLHFALLGQPEVSLGGHSVSFSSSRKALALLIYMAVEGGSHTRKKLAELFWPESDAPHGRATLRITLYEIRQLLHDFEQVTCPPYLLIDRAALELNLANSVSVDVWHLFSIWQRLQALSQTRAQSREETRQEQLELLTRATRLYRGAFLDGFSLRDTPAFDDWVRFQRDLWQLRIHQVFRQLISLSEEAGYLFQALETATRWLAVDPLHEETYQFLMRLYVSNGDRTAALQTYEACCTMLANEMQTEPLPETVALREHILSALPSSKREVQQGDVRKAGLDLTHGPLCGRSKEFQRLIRQYVTVCTRQVQVVLVEGEAGSGKTRLALDFLHWAEAQGAQILHGQAFEGSRRLAYQPLIEALRAKIEQENASPLPLSSVWIAELSRLLPELREKGLELSAASRDESLVRIQIFEAVARFLLGIEQRAPLVLLLEDLHWADHSLLGGLHYLMKRLTKNPARILLLLSTRTDGLKNSSTLREWWATMERIAPGATRISLAPLTREHILDFLRACIDTDSFEATRSDQPSLPPDTETADQLRLLAQWLTTQSSGNPFYLIESIQELIRRGLLAQRCDEQERLALACTGPVEQFPTTDFLPRRIQMLIKTQLERLSPTALSFALAVAIGGPRRSFEQHCSIADISETEGLEALDELLESGTLREYTGQEDTEKRKFYQFVHEKTRAVVCLEAGETRCRVYRSRAGLVAEALS
jgi:DNA-binding SARP family transcriptional activator